MRPLFTLTRVFAQAQHRAGAGAAAFDAALGGSHRSQRARARRGSCRIFPPPPSLHVRVPRKASLLSEWLMTCGGAQRVEAIEHYVNSGGPGELRYLPLCYAMSESMLLPTRLLRDVRCLALCCAPCGADLAHLFAVNEKMHKLSMYMGEAGMK
eukprot:2616634-Rhodomonas_salina.1